MRSKWFVALAAVVALAIVGAAWAGVFQPQPAAAVSAPGSPEDKTCPEPKGGCSSCVACTPECAVDGCREECALVCLTVGCCDLSCCFLAQTAAEATAQKAKGGCTDGCCAK